MKRLYVTISMVCLSSVAMAKERSFPDDLAKQIDYMKNLHAYERFEDLQAQISQLKNQVDQLSHQLNHQASNAGGSNKASNVSAEQQHSEQSMYHHALSLLKKKHYKEAQQQFNQFIEQYPDADLRVNATYWLGEIHLLYSEYDSAKALFSKLIKLNPEHAKVPDAMYKLGMIEYDLGHKDEAVVYFNRLLKEYQNASSAHLAQQQLKRMS